MALKTKPNYSLACDVAAHPQSRVAWPIHYFGVEPRGLGWIVI